MPVPHPVYGTYDSMVNDPGWNERLRQLNYRLRDAMQARGVPPLLSGNLFYDHLQPNFWGADLLKNCEEKRRRLFAVAQSAKNYFEVGVNGGHSMFLVLSANPDVRCTGVDLCERQSPKWGHVEIYVEVAIGWLQEMFPGRVTFLKGDCLVEIPKYVAGQKGVLLDLVHIDGDKRTYLRDLQNLWPLLSSETRVVFDDTELPLCRSMVDAVVRSGHAVIDPEFPEISGEFYQNSIVRLIK
jgi:hypothetical protein